MISKGFSFVWDDISCLVREPGHPGTITTNSFVCCRSRTRNGELSEQGVCWEGDEAIITRVLVTAGTRVEGDREDR